MKTINDPRLPNTTSLPDECSLEAVAGRKSLFLDLGMYSEPLAAEVAAVAQEQFNAKQNARFGIPYSENHPPVSSTIDCPVPVEPEPPMQTEETSQPQSSQAAADTSAH